MKFKFLTKSTYFSSDSISTVEILKKIKWFANVSAYYIGCDVMGADFTIFTLRFFLCIGNLFASYFLNFYNIYLFRDDLARVFFCMVTLAVSFQGVIKLYTFVFHRNKILSLFNRLEKFLTNCNSKRTNKIFEKWLMIMSHIGFFTTVLFLIGSFCLLIYPIAVYFIIGERILHFGFELPLIDWRTTTGYTLNFIYCGTLIYMFMFAQIAVWILNTTFIVVAFGQFEVLKVLLEDLNELAVTNDNGKHNEGIKKMIKTITQMHNELSE